MRKIYFATILAVILISLFTGCGKNNIGAEKDIDSALDNASNQEIPQNPKFTEKEIKELYDDGLDDALSELDIID